MSVNVGVVGYGNSAKVFHCPLIVSSPFLHLAAVVQRHGDHARDMYPWITVYKTTDDLFSSLDIDMVVITTPNESHYSLALEALQQGKHDKFSWFHSVVVEKPFTVTSKEAEELAILAKEKHLICSVYQNRRWDGDFLTVKKLIQDNRLGRLVEYESHFDRFRNYSKPGWKEESRAGSGMLYDLGSHLVDQAICLFGMPKTLFAILENERQIEGVDVVDSFTMILGYDNAFKAILRSSMLVRSTGALRFHLRGFNGSFKKHYLDVQEDQLKQGLVPSSANYGVEETSHHGTIDFDLNGVHIVGQVETEKGEYLSFYNNVGEAIIKKDPGHLEVSAEAGVNSIRLLELAQQSHREKRTITL
ncbi:hypothetical protein BDB01DRAFT_837407 [Pilobolus umbonatus]|nr:hypothetical protein BDB01DRAFT_837407 [Pilobolus umbonatus]